MVYSNKVRPLPNSSLASEQYFSVSSKSLAYDRHPSSNQFRVQAKEVNDLDSISTFGLEDSSYLKLRPFTRLDPSLERLLIFLNCFGLTVSCKTVDSRTSISRRRLDFYLKISKIIFMFSVALITGEVVYDVNLRQSKLLAEQKRSTPLLTFVIVAYSWLTIVIPFVCNLSLIIIGSRLFRFYSRTTATVCNGK